MASNRDWMYTMRTTSNGIFNHAFVSHVKRFLDFSFANTTDWQTDRTKGIKVSVIRCPCRICKNRRYKKREDVEGDLYNKGFVDDYKVWFAW